MRFWQDKCSVSGDPRYAVEMYSLTYYFVEIEGISEFRDRLHGTRWDTFKQIVLKPLRDYATGKVLVHGKYRAVRYGSTRAYILIRHNHEIARFLDTAISSFSDAE